MKLFVSRAGAGPTRCAILFGSGLIGSSVDQALHTVGSWAETVLPYPWSDAEGRGAAREAAMAVVVQEAAQAAGVRCDIIWTAGISGFGSDRAHMAREVEAFAEIATMAEALAARDGIEVALHLMSSAGGLFEGLAQVGRDTPPVIRRPYGEGKLAQEELAGALPPAVNVQIYRPTSVYGYIPSGRRGLFPTLIGNALQGRSSFISGRGTTLRDYVFTEDIGAFVARQVVTGVKGRDVHLLGSGRPVSMYEAITLIEDLVQRPVYRRYEPAASNAANMSFLRSTLPADWCVTPLATGLASVFIRMQNVHARVPGLLK